MARSINQTLKKKIFRIGSLGLLTLSVSGLLGSAGVNADGYSQYSTRELTQLHDREREVNPLERTQDMRREGRQDPGVRNEYGSSGYGYGYERRQAQGGFDGGIGHGLRGRGQ